MTTHINAPTASITLGRDAIRFVAGMLRMVIPRHKIVKFEHVATEDPIATLFYADTDGSVASANFKGPDAQAIEDWLMDGMPGVMVPAEAVQQAVDPRPKPGQEIGPGSIVEYLGNVYEVSRENHDGDIRKWRLSGHTSRGVNESALRLVTPIRKGDRVVLTGIDGGPGEAGVVTGVSPECPSHPTVFNIRADDGSFECPFEDRFVLHATRDAADGTVIVVR